MSLRDKINNWLSGPRGKEDGIPLRPPYREPPNPNTEQWLYMYGRSPLLAVVTKISEDLAFTPGRLFRRLKDGSEEEVEQHEFLDFWRSPNPLPELTAEAIWQLHQTYLLLVGEAFMIIERNRHGFPAELWPLPPHWVTGTPSESNPYYQIQTPGGYLGNIHMDDIFLQKELNPASPYGRGLGKAQGIADEVEIDEYASQFQKRFFYNDATPSTAISIENGGADAVERVTEQIQNNHQGVENSHKTIVTNGKISIAKFSENMKDLDMIEGRKFMFDRAMTHFHMPREIMGITENSNRATAEAAQYIYATNVQTPQLRKRGSAVTLQLTPYWGDDLFYRYDEIVPRNQEFDMQLALQAWKEGLATQGESREKLGFDRLENDDVIQVPLLFGFAKAGQDLSKLSQSQNVQEPDAFYFETDDKSRKIQKAQITQRDKHAVETIERSNALAERQAKNALALYLKQQATALYKSVQTANEGQKDFTGYDRFSELNNVVAGINDPIKRAERVLAYVERLIDWEASEEELRRILTNVWSNSYNNGRELMSNLFDLKNPHKPEVRDVFKRIGGQKISNDISQTTKEAIRDIIDAGLADGLDVKEMAQQIRGCSELSPERAQRIAEQETYNALSAANFDAMEENGVLRHKWVTRGDGLVRPSHAVLNGQVRQVGERFSNGLIYPRDRSGPAKEVIHCRCFTLPLREREPVAPIS